MIPSGRSTATGSAVAAAVGALVGPVRLDGSPLDAWTGLLVTVAFGVVTATAGTALAGRSLVGPEPQDWAAARQEPAGVRLRCSAPTSPYG